LLWFGNILNYNAILYLNRKLDFEEGNYSLFFHILYLIKMLKIISKIA
jgi:hypothetical protein